MNVAGIAVAIHVLIGPVVPHGVGCAVVAVDVAATGDLPDWLSCTSGM